MQKHKKIFIVVGVIAGASILMYYIYRNNTSNVVLNQNMANPNNNAYKS